MTAGDSARGWLRDAILAAGSHDRALWDRNVGERSRVASIYLALRTNPEITDEGWHVDYEYNRSDTDPKPAPQFDSTKGEWVVKHGTPDLVIHRRGPSGPANNLLVVEFKRTYSNLVADSHDARKVQFWAGRFGYRIGAVVGLGPRGITFSPRVLWLIDGTWSDIEDID
jgi:hypothetical protein